MNNSHGANGHLTGDPDICLTGGTVLNVYSGELLKSNVAIKNERFDYVGPLPVLKRTDTKIVDVEGKVLVPGYIEPTVTPGFSTTP